VFEENNSFRSAVLGIWVKTGSRHETEEKSGISHFIEHLLFKGTGTRSAEDIAVEADAMGSDLNAFTSRENTTFYIKVLDEFFEKGSGLLCDIFANSIFDPNEIEKEKRVVDEEIRLSEDTPDDHVFDLFNSCIWGDNGLSRPILGSAKTVGGITRGNILEYLEKSYNSNNIVIAIAGNIDTESCVRLLNAGLSGVSTFKNGIKPEKPFFNSAVKVHQKDLSEVHICMGFESIPNNSPERYALHILNTLFGSGVSSRLFQEIREKRGLVYSIYSFLSSYQDTGCMGIYAGASVQNYQKVIDLIMKESCSLKDTISERELQRTKKQLKGNMLLALESTTARMNNIAKQEIYYGRNFTPEEVITEIEQVGLEDVRALLDRIFRRDKVAVTLLGPAADEFSL
ncbi:MAG TPA: insulinase family protein, partial [Nitrospirae bacterium]|nr:insulinase family protein [Nitrospirota bacterium]